MPKCFFCCCAFKLYFYKEIFMQGKIALPLVQLSINFEHMLLKKKKTNVVIFYTTLKKLIDNCKSSSASPQYSYKFSYCECTFPAPTHIVYQIYVCWPVFRSQYAKTTRIWSTGLETGSKPILLLQNLYFYHLTRTIWAI